MKSISLKKAVIFALASLTGDAVAAQDSRNFLLTFGDSYSKTGFDPRKQAPGLQNPLGNPAYPGVTSSGGANWVGFMVTEFNNSIAYLPNTETVSYNFAQSGATVKIGVIDQSPSDFGLQVDTFLNYYSDGPKNRGWNTNNANAVVGVWFGINDIRTSYTNPSVDKVYSKLMDEYFAQVERLYNLGLRKFIFLTAPPMNLIPNFSKLNTKASSQLSSSVQTWNKLLVSRIKTFKQKNTKMAAEIIDTSVPFQKAYENPSAVGAKNPTCTNKDGKTCLWWDGLHAATPIERLVAVSAASVVQADAFKKAA